MASPSASRTRRWSRRAGVFQYYAAQSLSNYRDIYKTLRADPIIQKVHERYPFINIWDDHEFSNDCWGSNATYEDGRRTEKQDDRRRNAEQAFFEFLPIDTAGTAGEGSIDVDAEPSYPDTHIYRDFEFGKHVKLIVTDYRTYRPDHLIPEDGYPGTVVMDERRCRADGAAGRVKAFATDLFAYVDMDARRVRRAEGRPVAGVRGQLAVQAGLTPQEATAKAGTWVQGKLALAYVNQVLAAARAPPISPTRQAARPRLRAHGQGWTCSTCAGSRYMVVKDTYRPVPGVPLHHLGQDQRERVRHRPGDWLKRARCSPPTPGRWWSAPCPSPRWSGT